MYTALRFWCTVLIEFKLTVMLNLMVKKNKNNIKLVGSYLLVGCTYNHIL